MSLLGFHLHSAPGDITVSAMMLWLQLMGGGAARYDTNWSDYQAPPQPSSFSTAAASLPDGKFRDYLRRRGYGSSGQNLRAPLDALREAKSLGIRTVFNFGVIRDWAMPPRDSFPADAAGERRWLHSLADPAYPGEFLHDFILYTARQKDGMATLANTAGWQMFNEVNGIYGERAEQLPRERYFEIGEKTLALVQTAYAAVGLKKNAPAVILPSLGGAHNPLFYDAMIDHVVQDKTVAQVDGGLAIEAIAFHPYGMRVEPWLDPLTDEELGDETRDTLIYHRQLRPTDDRLTWAALVARDPAQSKALGLELYSSRANPADGYFDRNSEQGTEQTMAQLAQNGYGHVRVHFTEWGQTSWRGDAGAGTMSLWNTAFADPYKYDVVKAGKILPKAMAENVQAETVMQTVGLIESWDFVDTASVYEVFDQKLGEYEGEFGLARGVNAKGEPDWKPAGLAYRAYLSGKEIHLTHLMGKTSKTGVDIHVSARGASGGFNAAARNPKAHELVLLREGNDTFDAVEGDDVVFAGPGNDAIKGGEGYDRLFGGPDDDVLDGGAGADKLKGDAGDDVLSGGEGADHFVFAAYSNKGSGFAGYDTITDFDVREDKLLITGGYRVADLLDAVLFPKLAKDEAEGLRLTYADNGASIMLKGVRREQLSAANFHILQSDRTVAFGRVPEVVQTGSPMPDSLKGSGGDDLLDGGRGADVLAGGGGNDSYVIDSTDDAVVELPDAGRDRIVARVSYALPPDVEDLLLDSSKPLDATGNALDNELSGNNNRNTLLGDAGNDSLSGGAGRDTLDGSIGDDTLAGGSGNDDFVIRAGEGTDTISDFAVGDVIHLRGDTGFASPEAALAALREENGDLVLALAGGGQVVLRKASRAILTPESLWLD